MSDAPSTPRVRINGKEYEIPTNITLGEQRALKRVAGMRWSDIQGEMEAGDPDAITGFLFLVLHRADPNRPEGAILSEIESLTDADLGRIEGEAEGARPTEDGSQETIPEPAGSPPMATSST